MKLFGISGTNGSGKDSLGEILAKYHNYLFVSVTEFLRDECRRRRLPIEREYLRLISAEWRREHGLGVLVDKAVEAYNQADENYAGLVLSSLRNPGEADRLHELSGKLIWLDADPKVRYQRAFARQRSAEDQKSFEQFLAEEETEMNSKTSEETVLHIAEVKPKADIVIMNDTKNLEEFRQLIEQKLGLT